MCDFLIDFQKALEFDDLGFKFSKIYKVHTRGDFVYYNKCADTNIIIEKAEKKILDQFQWLTDNFSLLTVNSRVFIKLNRSFMFQYGCKHFSNFENLAKINIHDNISVNYLPDSNPISVQDLRVQIVQKVLNALVKRLDDLSSKETCITVHLSLKHDKGICGIPLLVGPVISSLEHKALKVDADYYISKKKSELERRASTKLDSNSSFDHLDNLLNACLTIDMIHSAVHIPVKLVLDDIDNGNMKGAVFIMYNYVRLEALCAKYDELVAQGIFSHTPPIDEVDFSLLKSDDEWALMFDFILNWPNTLITSIGGICSGKVKIHNIVTFLTTLSSSFSGYYHRTRILTEPRPVLMGVLHARMYLIRSLKVVFNDALRSIGITPFSVM